MKKTILFFVLFALFFNVKATKQKCVTRETGGGGLFGYKYTTRKEVITTNPDGTTTTCVNIHCDEPGLSHCPRSVSPPEGGNLGDYTPAEINLMQQFMDYALNQIELNNLSGSSSQRILIVYSNGATIEYLYELTWSSTDANGLNSIIEITREIL